MRKNVRQVLETIVVIPKAMLSPLFLIKEHSIVNLEATNKVMACTNQASWCSWMASKLQKQPKLVQKNNKKFVYCTSFDYLCGMITDLEHIGNIPVSTATVASLFPEMSAGNQKVLQLETAGKVIRLKRGLYVIAPKVSRDTPVGRFEYQMISREAFSVGVTSINQHSYSFLMATPEKALCDLIANSPNVNLRYLKDVEAYLEGDIRMDIDDFLRMDVGVFERYAQVGKKGKSIETLIKYMKK